MDIPEKAQEPLPPPEEDKDEAPYEPSFMKYIEDGDAGQTEEEKVNDIPKSRVSITKSIMRNSSGIKNRRLSAATRKRVQIVEHNIDQNVE